MALCCDMCDERWGMCTYRQGETCDSNAWNAATYAASACKVGTLLVTFRESHSSKPPASSSGGSPSSSESSSDFRRKDQLLDRRRRRCRQSGSLGWRRAAARSSKNGPQSSSVAQGHNARARCPIGVVAWTPNMMMSHTHALTHLQVENTSRAALTLIHAHTRHQHLTNFDVPNLVENRYQANGKSSYPDQVPTPTESSDAGSIPISPFEPHESFFCTDSATSPIHTHAGERVAVRVTAGGKCNCSDLPPSSFGENESISCTTCTLVRELTNTKAKVVTHG